MRGLIARMRSLWRGIRRGAAVESEMAEEFRLHLELRTADLVRGGLSPAEAARQARLEFGHIDGHVIDARASRGLAPFDQLRFSVLDVRLGIRMLAKYPGLSVVSVLGMAVGIAIGAGAFSFIESMMETTLPLPDGERVVALRNAIITEPGKGPVNDGNLVMLTWVAVLMTTVGLLASIGPARRGLAVQPTEALREE